MDITKSNIQTIFENSDHILYNERNSIKVITHNNQKLVVKSFKVPNIINQIAYKYIRDSKAKRSYKNGLKLCSLNINTPKPIKYIEFKNKVLTKSFFISHYIKFDFEIREVVDNQNFPNRVQILKEFARFCFEIHQKGVYHIDFSPGNILVTTKNDHYQFYLIDLNRMKFKKMNKNLRMQSISKMAFSTNDYEYILQQYASLYKKSKKELMIILNKYIKKQQNYLTKKKKFKKLIKKIKNLVR